MVSLLPITRRDDMIIKKIYLATSLALLAASANSFAETKTLEQLTKENEELRQRLERLESLLTGKEKKHDEETKVVKTTTNSSNEGYVRFNHAFSYEMLDPTTNINRKQQLLLERKKDGTLAEDVLYISAAATPIVNYQKSNTESKFGYLMRHPTSANQRTETVSEAAIHSAQFALTANLGEWTTAYIEMLYDPQQSFGAGTTTDLNRNQVQVRQGYVMFGDLSQSPYYVSVGKMATPFGLTDTVNPFTAGTVWHAFGGLAYGINGGYLANGWDINLMAIQGGAQFRAHHVPVDGSAVPSKLNNFAFDINKTFGDKSSNVMVGASYTKGSAYCQGFPVVHFQPCAEANGAYDIYAQYNSKDWVVQFEYAQTEDKWPGTFNPAIPQFAASDVVSWNLGGKYKTESGGNPLHVSFDYSVFEAGPSGSPWEKQEQIVFGLASYLNDSTKLFAEIIRTEGYAPLNFISGGGGPNVGPGETHSDADASSTVLMIGANVAF